LSAAAGEKRKRKGKGKGKGNRAAKACSKLMGLFTLA
jgi:hypothetical protein